MEAEIDKIGTKTRLEEWVYTADYAIPLLERQLGANGARRLRLGERPGGRDRRRRRGPLRARDPADRIAAH